MKYRRFWWLLVFVIAFLINIKPVFATGGGLRKNSIKTCPDGVTYGKHSDGKGGMHWHRAATNGSNYYAVGEAIYEDPCPGSSGNQGTAESTHGDSNNSNSNGNSSSSNDTSNNSSSTSSNETSNDTSSNSSNSSSNDLPNDSIINNVPVEPQKSSDTGIEYITINGDKITSISDEMSYETNKKDISIEVKTSSDKAVSKVDGNMIDLDTNNVNKIEIVVTAEDETTKTYVLNVTRKVVEYNVEIQQFMVNGSTVTFENNKGSISLLNSNKELKCSYKLSDEDAILKILTKDGEDITDEKIMLNEGYNYFDILITDSYGNTSTYELEIEKLSSGGSIIISLIAIVIILVLFLGPPVGIVLLIVFLAKKKKKY